VIFKFLSNYFLTFWRSSGFFFRDIGPFCSFLVSFMHLSIHFFFWFFLLPLHPSLSSNFFSPLFAACIAHGGDGRGPGGWYHHFWTRPGSLLLTLLITFLLRIYYLLYDSQRHFTAAFGPDRIIQYLLYYSFYCCYLHTFGG